jgi:hypothetical protein
MAVDEFNAYLDTLATKPEVRELAVDYLRPREPYTIDVVSRTGGSNVTLVRDDLEDDSVAAQRFTLEVGLGSDGLFLGSARVDYRCQAGRGHQDFSPELCL